MLDAGPADDNITALGGEILSSSLEAFRKIRQERANVRAASDAEKMGLDHPFK